MTDFPSLLRALGAAGVEFIVVGGAAATAHGSARLTLDLDVVSGERRTTWRAWCGVSKIIIRTCGERRPACRFGGMLTRSVTA
jgi:hypothetical protein